jgi:hypothetical protein
VRVQLADQVQERIVETSETKTKTKQDKNIAEIKLMSGL